VADNLDPAAVERAVQAWAEVYGIDPSLIAESDSRAIRAALAAAGPLVTPEHDAQVAEKDLRLCGRPNGYPARDCTREYGHDGDHWHSDLHLASHDAQVAARALWEAADEAEAVRADADCAEACAPVSGEQGRTAVIERAADMHEEPWTWLRARADRIERQEGGR